MFVLLNLLVSKEKKILVTKKITYIMEIIIIRIVKPSAINKQQQQHKNLLISWFFFVSRFYFLFFQYSVRSGLERSLKSKISKTSVNIFIYIYKNY